jgi:hypothetical protein
VNNFYNELNLKKPKKLTPTRGELNSDIFIHHLDLGRFFAQLVQFSLSLKKSLHFFPYCVSVVHEIKSLDNKSPQNITSLNIDRWIDL